MIQNFYVPSAPALPRKNAPSSAKPKNKKITTAEEDKPPPPLPRKPQMHDPLGVLNSEMVSPAQSPLKYQSLDTREFHSNGYSANNSSSGDSSPPSSLSAESTNSENTKSANINKVHLGAIPKRKPNNMHNSHEDNIQGMAKHMKRNKAPR